MDSQDAFQMASREIAFKHLSSYPLIYGEFYDWFNAQYAETSSARLFSEGEVVKTYEISAGVRQGCPSSMMMYVLASLPLYSALPEGTTIYGYADDHYILTRDEDSLTSAISRFKHEAAAIGQNFSGSKEATFYGKTVISGEDKKVLGGFILGEQPLTSTIEAVKAKGSALLALPTTIQNKVLLSENCNLH